MPYRGFCTVSFLPFPGLRNTPKTPHGTPPTGCLTLPGPHPNPYATITPLHPSYQPSQYWFHNYPHHQDTSAKLTLVHLSFLFLFFPFFLLMSGSLKDNVMYLWLYFLYSLLSLSFTFLSYFYCLCFLLLFLPVSGSIKGLVLVPTFPFFFASFTSRSHVFFFFSYPCQGV